MTPGSPGLGARATGASDNLNSTDEVLCMIVEDYLQRKGMTDSLQAFRRENGSTSSGDDRVLAWYNFASKLQLPLAEQSDLTLLEGMAKVSFFVIRYVGVRNPAST